MSQKKILSFLIPILTIALILIFLLPFSFGMISDSVNLTGITGQQIEQNISIFYDNTTQHVFPIYNLTITNQSISGFNSSTIESMIFQENKTMVLGLKQETPFYGNITAILSYYYLVDGTRDRQEIIIDVNESGYYPQGNITIYINDTITWRNTGQGNHTVTNINNLVDMISLQPGQNYSRIFNSMQEFRYFDYGYTTLEGRIIVLNNAVQIYSHSPNFDIPMTFLVNISYPAANMTVQLLPLSFEANYNEKKIGILRLISNDTMHNVHLSGEWFEFPEQGFDFEKERIIIYNMTPSGITKTNQTDMIYPKSITITAESSAPVTVNIPVYIKPANLSNSDEDEAAIVLVPMTAEQTFAYCNKEEINWTIYPCNRYLKNITVIKEVERVLHPEINESTAYDATQAGKRADEGVSRISNKIDEQIAPKIDNLDSRLTAMENTVNNVHDNTTAQLNYIAEDVTEKKQSQDLTSFWTFLFLFIAGGVVAFVLIKRWILSRRPEYEMKW